MNTFALEPNTLLTWAWQTSILLLLAMVLANYCKARPARAHWILLLGLAAALASPPASLLARERGWGLIPSSWEDSARVTMITQGSAPNLRNSVLTGREDLEKGAPDIKAEEGIVGERPQNRAIEASPSSGALVSRMSWPAWITMAWFLGSALLGLRLIFRLGKERKLLSGSQSLDLSDGAMAEALDAAVRRMELKVFPILRRSPHIQSPAISCWGRRPVILLPHRLVAVDASDLDWESVFMHELAHWKRCDHWWELVASLVVTAMPWQPLAWWARRNLRQCAELACDDWSVSEPGQEIRFAESLSRFAADRLAVGLQSALSHPSNLQQRVKRILSGGPKQPRCGGAWSLGAVAIFAGILLSSSLGQRGKGESVEFVQTRAFDPGVTEVWVMALAPDGDRVAIGSPGAVEVRELDTGKRLGRVEGAFGAVNGLEWSPAGDRLALGAWNKGGVQIIEKAPGSDELKARMVAVHKKPKEASDEKAKDDSPPVGTILPQDWSADGNALLCVELIGEEYHLGELIFPSEQWRRLSLGKDGADRMKLEPRYSSDGRSLAYLTEIDSRWVIRLVDRESGEQLSHYDAYEGRISGLLWTSDGSQLVFKGSHGEQEELLALSVKDSLFAVQAVPILADARGLRLMDGSPGGVVLYEKRGFTDGVMVQPVDPAKGEAIGFTRRVSNQGRAVYDWSPDSKWIAQQVSQGLKVVDAATGQPRGTLKLPRRAGGTPKSVSWSPDSTRIAWPSENKVLMVNAASGETLKEFESDDIERVHTNAMWSPDGKVILVKGQTKEGEIGLLTVDAENGEFRMAVPMEAKHPGYTPDPRWHPNSRQITYRDASHVYVADVETGDRLRIAEGAGDDEGPWVNHGPPLFSPAGTALAYVEWSGREVGGELRNYVKMVVSSLDGKEKRTLFENEQAKEGQVVMFDWSPDGRFIVYPLSIPDAATGDRSLEIWMVATSGEAAPRRLVSDPAVKDPWLVRWSPDGQSVAFFEQHNPLEYGLAELRVK